MAKSFQNAVGQVLYASGTSTAWFSATGSGPTLNGTAGNDSIWGDSSVNVTMSGGTGDDIYYLYSTITHAVEAPGGGIDTINTWMSYTLPANFENLTVTGEIQSGAARQPPRGPRPGIDADADCGIRGRSGSAPAAH